MRKILFVLFLFSSFFGYSFAIPSQSGFSITRSPASIYDLGLINSKVFIFFKRNAYIVIKQCEDYTDLTIIHDCEAKKGTVEKHLPVNDFKNSLKKALAYSDNKFDDEVNNMVEIYIKGQNEYIQDLSNKKNDLIAEINKIKQYISRYGSQEKDIQKLSELSKELAIVKGELGVYIDVDLISKLFDEKINNLVDNIIASDRYYSYSAHNQTTGFVFNILEAYLKAPPISPDFIKIPKGTFRMGSDYNHKGVYVNAAVNVEITNDFEIMATELTQMQWFKVMGKNPSRFKKAEDCDSHISINGVDLCPNNPVEQVSWNEVQAYIKKLNDSLGLYGCNGTPSDSKGCYRLPTEAEWEYAAGRGGSSTYSFNGEWNELIMCEGKLQRRLNCYAWYNNNSKRKTHPVASKLSNANELYDMHGNVWEWVQDSYQGRLSGGRDPLIQNSTLGDTRVVRGGSWYAGMQELHPSYYLRSTTRGFRRYNYFMHDIGFRLVRSI